MTNEPASPLCGAATADDGYRGQAPRVEILAALNDLLEAERAGARIALHGRKDASNPAMLALINAVRDDEARWCAMLKQQIVLLNGKPSAIRGAFYSKAMAIETPVERRAFVNRGQSRGIRKVRAMLPGVRDDTLHVALREMLLSHEVNIAQTAALIQFSTQPWG